jgi:hypothetical protein
LSYFFFWNSLCLPEFIHRIGNHLKDKKMELIALSVICGAAAIFTGVVVFTHKKGTLK